MNYRAIDVLTGYVISKSDNKLLDLGVGTCSYDQCVQTPKGEFDSALFEDECAAEFLFKKGKKYHLYAVEVK